MPSTNAQLAATFQRMADVMEIQGANRFKVIAFQKAARVLDDLAKDVATLPRDELKSIEGIGKGTADRIGEFLDTGKIADHDEMVAAIPGGLFKLLDIPGMGAKTVALLWHEGGVTDLASLQAGIDSGELEKLKGLGKKKLENIAKNIAFAESAAQRTRLGEAMPIAEHIVAALREVKGVKKIDYAGSLRRGRETIGDIDILVGAAKKDAEKIAEAFVSLDLVDDIIIQGPTKSSIRTANGLQVDLRVVEPAAYGAALMYFTGSKEHNVKLRERAQQRGMTLNEYRLEDKDSGRAVASKTEEDVYAALDLKWIAPEMREDRGEIMLAEKDNLPRLIELSDIKAELHAHTTASDGRWSIRELARAAAERGFHTVAITDHSKGQVQANGLDDARLEKHIEAVREAAAEMKDTIAILAGSEVDILVDGRMDYPDSLLKELDVVVASPHASLAQDPDKATKRLLRAIENPYVTIMGHPTGRLVLRREGLHPDMDALIAAAAERGIAMEINANHYRLDLRDTHARAAIEAGVKLAINTDAHGPADLDELRYGVLTARRAGAIKSNVVNCMSKTTLKKWIASTRGP